MSDDEHDQFDFDEDSDMRPVTSVATPWWLQQPWTFIAGFILVGTGLYVAGNYLNPVVPRRASARARR